jgi:hypothetical protein
MSPSNNGRGSDAWSRSWTHISLDRRSPNCCRVTFDYAPINTITATTVVELAELVGSRPIRTSTSSGAGSEFVLACDLRFASRENSLLG